MHQSGGRDGYGEGKIMATTRSRGNSITKPVADSVDKILESAKQVQPLPNTKEENIQQATIEALQTLLQTLSIAPSGQTEVPTLQKRLFQVTAPRPGFNITIPNPLSLGDPFTLTVTPDVRWEALNEEGEALSSGDGFVADPPSLDALGEQMLFFPQLVKDEAAAPDSVAFTLRASVRLTVTHPITGEEITVPKNGRAALPPVTVSVPVALRIPSILAFFRHKSFATQSGDKQGFALVFVPPGSSISAVEDLADDGALGTLVEEVGALRTAIEALPVSEQSLLATLAGNLEGFLDGLHSLVSNLARFGPASAAPIALRLEGSNDNLNVKELSPSPLNDIEGDNEINSLIFIGLGETVRLYNRREFRDGQGILQIETGAQMCAVIVRLDRATPTATIGDSTITTPEPANFSDLQVSSPNTFDNTILSFHFGKNPPM